MSANVEDRVVICGIDFRELFCVGELVLDSLVAQEPDAFVVFECLNGAIGKAWLGTERCGVWGAYEKDMWTYLDTVLINGRVRAFGSRKVNLCMRCENIVRVSSLREIPALFIPDRSATPLLKE